MKRCHKGIFLLVITAYLFSGCSVEGEAPSTEIIADSQQQTSELVQNSAPIIFPVPAPSPIPVPLPTSPVISIDPMERLTVTEVLPSTENYEEYLTEDLVYHDAYVKDEGSENGTFDINLPQFRDNMPCYQQLNTYFQEQYEQALVLKECYYTELSEEKELSWEFEQFFYQGMTVGEQYLTVYLMWHGYHGGIRYAADNVPVTFDLQTGMPVTLPEILNLTEQEIKNLVADYVYGYFLSQSEYAEYTYRDTYLCYDPTQFYMLEEGVGVYYPRYAIECGAAGDFLFVIPYEELGIHWKAFQPEDTGEGKLTEAESVLKRTRE